MFDPQIDEKNMEITFSCASSEPYRRYDFESGREYMECLVISPDAVNMERLNSGASILKNHDTDKILGKTVRAWVEGGNLLARAKFRENDPESMQIFRDICANTLQNVSLGYTQDDIAFRKNGDQLFGDVVRWTPLEVSVAVGVPADPTVGFFRSMNITGKDKNMSAENENKNTPPATPEVPPQEPVNLPEKPTEPEATQGNPPAEPPPATPPEQTPPPAEPPAAPERAFSGEVMIRSMADAAGHPEYAESAIKRGLTPEAFLSDLKKSQNIQTLNQRKTTTMETRKYSMQAALRSLVTGKGAEYEREISEGLYANAGLSPSDERSIMIPFRRDTTIFDTTVGVGDKLVGTDHRPDLFVEYIQKRIGVKNATFLTGLRGNLSIPAQTGAGTAYFVDTLNTDLTATNPVIGNISLTPKKMGAYTIIGKDLLVQGTPDAQNLVMRDLMNAISQKIGIVILKGNDASPEIIGVNTATGVKTVEIASIASAGWSDMLKFAAEVEGLAFSGALEFIMSASDKQTFKGISKDTGSGRFLCEDNQIDGYPVSVDGNLSSGEIFFGDFSNALVGQWGGIELMVDPYTYALSGKIRVIANVIIDVAVRNAHTFVKRIETVATT